MVKETTIKFKGDIKDFEKRMQEIQDRVQKVSNVLKDAGNQAAKSFDTGAQRASVFSKSLGDVTVAEGLAGIGTGKLGALIKETFVDAVNRANEYEKAIVGVNSVAKNMGQDTVQLNKYLQDLTKDGLVPFADAAASIKNLLASGLSIEQAVNLFNSLKDAAAFNRQGTLSMGEAIVGATQGIKNQNSIMVDNAGITKNLSIIWKEYAVTIGKTADELTDAEKAQAAYVGITKEAAVFQGDAAKAAQTYGGQVDKLANSYNRLLIAGGSLITQSKLVNVLIETTANTIERLVRPDDNSRSGRIAQIREQLDLLRTSGSSAYGTIQDLTTILDKLEKEEADAKRSRESLAGVDQVDEVIQNGKNRARIAILDRKAREAQAVEDMKARNEQQKKQQELYNKLLVQYQDFNTDRIKEFENAMKRELKIAGDNEQLKLSIRQSYAQKIYEFEQKNNDKLAKLRGAQAEYEEKLAKDAEKRAKNREELFKRSVDNPFKAIADNLDPNLSADEKTQSALGGVGGALSQIAGGSEGARNLITQGAATGLGALLGSPELGQALSPLISGLTQGPEATREFVKSFTDAIPEIISNLAEALPVLVEELADQLPVVIDRLIDKVPDIVGALVRASPAIISALALESPKIIAAMVKNVPSLVKSFIDGLKDGAGEFVQKLIDAVNPFSSENNIGSGLNKLNPFGGEFLEFANGGQPGFVGQVPSGFDNDRYPSLLSSRELVVKPKLTNQLESFLNNGGSSPRTEALLSSILNSLNKPVQVSTTVEVSNKAFADIILTLNRSNMRLA